MKLVSALAVAAVLALPSPVLAGESWGNATADITYEFDLPRYAVFGVIDNRDSTLGRIFVEGLTVDDTDRGTYKALWVTYNDETPCSDPLIDPTGATVYNWGRMLITFDDSETPPGWSAQVGTCDGPLSDFMGVLSY